MYKSVSVILHHCFLENVHDLKKTGSEICLNSIYFCLTLFSLLSCLIKQAERRACVRVQQKYLNVRRRVSYTTCTLPSKVINSFDIACGDYKLHVTKRGQEHSHEEP